MTVGMRWLVSAMGLAAASVAAVTPAAAADMYRQPAPYTVQTPLNVYSWAGPYLGANVGYQWGEVSNSGVEPTGVAGGLQLGYNWQTGQFVYGIETDLQISG